MRTRDFSNINTHIEIDEKSVVITGNKESKNLIAMLMLILSTNSSDFSIGTHFDIKLIKKEEDLKVEFGKFKEKDVNNRNINVSDEIKICDLLDFYKEEQRYDKILTNEYFELGTLLSIITDYGTKIKNDMQIAIKNNGFTYEIGIGLEIEDTIMKDAISKAGIVFELNETTIKAKIDSDLKNKVNDILFNLRSADLKQQIRIKEFNSQTGSANKAFLISILVAEMILLLVGSFFMFR